MTNAQNVVSKINASITTLQELLEEGITSEEIMRSYRANLRSTEQQHRPLSRRQILETKGSKLNKEDIEEAKTLAAIPQVIFAHISNIDEQMSLLSVAQRIGNPTIFEQTIKDEIATQSSDFLHTVGLKALLNAISSQQPHISIQETQPFVKLEDLLITNTQTMVTKLLQTSHIVYNSQVRNISRSNLFLKLFLILDLTGLYLQLMYFPFYSISYQYVTLIMISECNYGS